MSTANHSESVHSFQRPLSDVKREKEGCGGGTRQGGSDGLREGGDKEVRAETIGGDKEKSHFLMTPD